jgi:amidase
MRVTDGVRAALARLDAVEDLGAVVARDDITALVAANELDASPSPGALPGRPITIKDWIDVAGLPCEGESPEPTGRRPTRDATAVARLRAAGAIVVAKSQPQAHHPQHGQCHNPVDHARSPGGSSSGEAALIGAGASTLGLGSDSGGSIRLPAAWCGVFGFKPSYGLVPATGHYPRVWGRHDGRSVIGPLTRRVDDLVTVIGLIAGPDGVDPDCVPVPRGDPDAVESSGLRVAVVDEQGSWRPAASTSAAVARAVSALERRGAVVAPSDALPTHLDEAYDITDRYWRRRSLTGSEVDQQLRDWDRLSGRLTRAAASFDLVVGPVVRDVAPIARPMVGEDFGFTVAWSLTGWPAVSVPAGLDDATGLPLAVQVAAPRWHDHVVLAAAGWLAEVLGGDP